MNSQLLAVHFSLSRQVCIRTAFLFIAEKYSIVWIRFFFLYFLPVMDYVTMNICVQIFVSACFSFSWVHVCLLSSFRHVQFFVILWIVARQAPLSMGFSRQDYWSGLPCPPPGDLPDLGIKPRYPACPALAGRPFITSVTSVAPLPLQIIPLELLRGCCPGYILQ